MAKERNIGRRFKLSLVVLAITGAIASVWIYNNTPKDAGFFAVFCFGLWMVCGAVIIWGYYIARYGASGGNGNHAHCNHNVDPLTPWMHTNMYIATQDMRRDLNRLAHVSYTKSLHGNSKEL